MRNQYTDFNPGSFMQNFAQNFQSEDFFEHIRRMSEQEAEANRKKK